MCLVIASQIPLVGHLEPTWWVCSTGRHGGSLSGVPPVRIWNATVMTWTSAGTDPRRREELWMYSTLQHMTFMWNTQYTHTQVHKYYRFDRLKLTVQFQWAFAWQPAQKVNWWILRCKSGLMLVSGPQGRLWAPRTLFELDLLSVWET